MEVITGNRNMISCRNTSDERETAKRRRIVCRGIMREVRCDETIAPKTDSIYAGRGFLASGIIMK